MKHPVYLDYNATTPVDPEVAKEMLPYIESFYGNPSSSYSLGRSNKEAVEKARVQVAELINCQPQEIYFTSCATESNNLAIKGIAWANSDKGRHIITSAIEHPAVTEVCKFLGSQGFEITNLLADKYGWVNPKDVESAIRKDTVLITVMHANNEVGTIQPIQEIGAIARQNDILFHTDASQSVGKIETDVNQLGVDLLTLAGHKLYAPKGIGALYIRKGTQIENLMQGAGQENGIRPGTENVIHIVGLGKACEVALRDFKQNQHNMQVSRDLLLDGLVSQLGNQVHVNGSMENCLPNTLSVAFENVSAYALASFISSDVLISTGSACHSGETTISSVLQAMNLDFRTAAATVRISTGKKTKKEEIDFTVEVITNAVKKLTI
ncbi:MAG: cysteine desulfurase NifS [Bacteroidetes bacterium GWF2_42_66]|nr:MAG: cysteine desulfurase NifS [Bacteroidetes bacterium GWA2_42_15]OFY03274.1 MAG: cysteine desulfurase NifS [Bacteroidetes bacterium GWE2_42_39]OFY45676.1 MAG: cysteine desulfurase NifS [Bacteroidetes bacterium GWF2_42_66]HBL77338.1 cysteine desulfurase NifS [Prolixibacteraceae bacterium]HCU62496.1 cysteine desulfurase NifS [Prolixibacteraceae bacterium]